MSKAKTFVALILVLIGTVTAFSQKSNSISHARAVSILHDCHVRLIYDCDGEKIESVIRRYRRGDLSLLPPLLKAIETADGSFAEDLDGFYGEELQRNTTRFLTAVSRLPKDLREKVCLHTYVNGDRAAMKRLEKRLTRIIKKKNNISQVARLCMYQIPDEKASPNPSNK